MLLAECTGRRLGLFDTPSRHVAVQSDVQEGLREGKFFCALIGIPLLTVHSAEYG